MGGVGSGPQWGSRYRSVENSPSLDMRSLGRNGVLRPGKKLSIPWAWWSSNGESERCTASIMLELDFASSPTYALRYSVECEGKEPETVHIQARLLQTTPTYGGTRWWFACPRCGRRVRVLYLPNGSTRFACRRCHQLRYHCQRETFADRLLRKSRKLYRRAGGHDEGCSFVYKPKGMHHRTFNRLMDAADGYSLAAVNAVPVCRSLLRRLQS